MSEFSKITLDNGLRIILSPQSQSLAITALVLVEAGSKYETKNINGISHFLEHMCFKGTKKRPKAIDIAGELDGMGAIYNAFTGHEYTGYFIKSRPDYSEKILDILSDIYINQVFEQKEIDKERGVIIEEINMYEDLPMRKVQELFTELLYGDQPAGWNIAGRKEVIKSLMAQDFISYRSGHYLANATIVVVAGNFNEEKMASDIKKYFSGIPEKEKISKIKTTESQEKPSFIVRNKETDQTHLVVGVRAFDIFDKRKYVLDVLSDILGGGMSSRLFQKIRDELGAAYYVRAGADLYTDHGYLAVSAGINHNKIKVVIGAIIEEFKNLAEKEVPAEELEKSKQHLIGNLVLDLETSDQWANFYGAQEVLTKKTITPEELIEKIQKVSQSDIKKLSETLFKNEKLNLAVIGPFKDGFEIGEVLKL